MFNNNYKIYTCSKHNYSSINSPCPDCSEQTKDLISECDKYKAAMEWWKDEAGRQQKERDELVQLATEAAHLINRHIACDGEDLELVTKIHDTVKRIQGGK